MSDFDDVLLILLISCILTTACSHHCCIPHQWEGFQDVSATLMVGNENLLIEAIYKTSYDWKLKKIHARGSGTLNGKPFKEETLYDYKKKVIYDVIGGICSITPLPGKMFSCIPDFANLTFSSFYGYGEHTVPIQMYMLTMMDTHITMTVVKDSCMLLEEHYSGLGTMENSRFIGVKPGITDPAVFNVPAECKRLEISSYTKTYGSFIYGRKAKWPFSFGGINQKNNRTMLLSHI